MASPPAKRRRKSSIILSDDDNSSDESSKGRPQTASNTNSKVTSALKRPSKSVQASPPRQSISSRSSKRKAAPKGSPKSSPEKSKRGAREEKEAGKIKSLHTFFAKATEEQRWRKRTNSPDEEIADGEAGDAIVDDDSLDEALLEFADGKSGIQYALDRRKPTFTAPSGLRSTQEAPSLSQRFVIPALPQRKAGGGLQRQNAPVTESHRPWSDRYGPTNLDELAVHKKKVSDVQKWLTDVLSGQDRRRLLILKGPAGSGKSTTVSLLSKALAVPLIPWINPTASEVGSTLSVAAQFSEFLNRSGQYGSLDFDGQTQFNASSSRRILVVEEFPMTITRSSSALDSFRSVLLQYVAASVPTQPTMFEGKSSNLDTHPPVVMIITETLLTSNTAATDSFTAHRLLGPEISNHPLVTITEFNPVATTFVMKALDLVIKKEARDSTRRRTPGPAVLQRLAEIGDIRSAVNSLEFLCVRGDDTGDWSGTVAVKPKKSAKDGVPLTAMEKQSLELVSQRETTLDMFHAVGKVVYNKREDPRISGAEAEPLPKLPDHIMHFDKPKISQVNVEALLNETGTDIQTFLSTLHENYVLSCHGTSFVEAFTDCSGFLSDSDILNPDSRTLSRSARYGVGTGITALQSGGTDLLRQDEISFQVATRGLLFSLPFPVSRAAHPGGRKADSFKMFYPASLRLWKPTEEIESLISLYMSQLRLSSTQPFDAAVSTTRGEGVSSWQQRHSSAFSAPNLDTANDGDEAAKSIALPSREALTLVQLPYLTKLLASRKKDSRTLSRITQFHGLNVDVSGEESPDEDGEERTEASPPMGGRGRFQLASVVPRSRQSQPPAKSTLGLGAGSMQEVVLEKLYISDDDIQDD